MLETFFNTLLQIESQQKSTQISMLQKKKTQETSFQIHFEYQVCVIISVSALSSSRLRVANSVISQNID